MWINKNKIRPHRKEWEFVQQAKCTVYSCTVEPLKWPIQREKTILKTLI